MKPIALLVLLALSLVACQEEAVPDPASLSEVQINMADPEAVARGAALFAGSCAGFCHALEPVETTDASFLFDCDWTYGSSDEEIGETVRSGIPGTSMVGFGTNFPEGDTDLWKIVAYLRSNQSGCEAVE